MVYIRYFISLCILLTPVSSYSMEPQEKKRKIEVTPSHSHIIQSLCMHVPYDPAKIIESYCEGPYFFAHYINDDHEQKGEDIIQVSMAPHKGAIATYGFNTAKNSGSVHINILNTNTVMAVDIKSPEMHDMGWNYFSNQLAVTSGKGEIDVVQFGLNKYPPRAHSPASIVVDDRTYYCLRNTIQENDSSVSCGLTLFSTCSGSKEIKSIHPLRIRESAESRPTSIDKVTFALETDDIYILAFQKLTNTLSIVCPEALERSKPTLRQISAVDFSQSTFILGHQNGSVNSFSKKTLELSSTIQAFEGIPIELVIAHRKATLAMAQKKIRIFDNGGRRIAELSHHGPESPSHMALSSDFSLVAYAAGRTLYVKSMDGSEQQQHVFSQPISSLFIDNKDNLLLTQGGQLITLVREHMQK